MRIDSIISKYEDSIISLSEKIYGFAELGSTEYKSSALVINELKNEGFTITNPYMGMDTAFRAEYGVGSPVVGILMEYDALPNGHSCGHNLISAWAYGTAITVKNIITSGKIVVFGTPSEEGIGPYAGSKARMAASGAFRDIDFVIGMHPDDIWAVGSKALADAEMEFTFHGKAAHMAASPCYGVNALDALVTTYGAINNLRDSARGDKNIVIGMVIREGGQASNVVPDRAVMEVDVRSSSSSYLSGFVEKVKKLAHGIAEGYGATLDISDLMPVYTEYSANRTVDIILQEEMERKGLAPINIDKTDEPASGSTDEANVSLVVPTGHIDMKIGTGLPGHSDEFRDAANPQRARQNLLTTINVSSSAIVKIMENKQILNSIKSEFDRHGK
ncbi:amidohydrolase [Ferroplasma sp.]|uniref:amidohydrolase n=1 Tax=Ferroplasma sp. TaxID=2591003 RepID=UPI0026224A8C|nr:amidohydrolase [Ferroplasma sp.]